MVCCCLNSPAMVLPFLWISSFTSWVLLWHPTFPSMFRCSCLVPHMPCAMVAPTCTWLEALGSDEPTVQCTHSLMFWGHHVLADLPVPWLETAQLRDPLETGTFFGSSVCTQDMVFSEGLNLF